MDAFAYVDNDHHLHVLRRLTTLMLAAGQSGQWSLVERLRQERRHHLDALAESGRSRIQTAA